MNLQKRYWGGTRVTNRGAELNSIFRSRRSRGANWTLLVSTAIAWLLAASPCLGAFVESGGLVVMEAEHFQSYTIASGHAWVATNDVAGFVGTAAMRAVPNSGASFNTITNSPELTYAIQITNSGTFKLWIRGWSASGSDDSVQVGVDRRGVQTVGYGQNGVWIWKFVQVTITNSGAHQISLWMREDGAYVDRLLLARSSTYTPTGNGPPETMPVVATFRWASESGRIYVESGGTATLTDIKAALPAAPLCLVDPTKRIWFLNASLVVSDGAKLLLHGSAFGGDVNELRLRSDNSPAEGSCVSVDADWGTLDIRGVRITSWDQLTARPDTEHTTFQRACVRALSRQTGSAAQQSTLNVVNSEVAYLGVDSTEAYGLTWQMFGSGPDASVFGVVSNSYIHDCRLGLETTFWNDVVWTGNTIVSNMLYGFDPAGNNSHDNSYSIAYRWADSSQRIYVTGPGNATLSSIKNALPGAPLTLVDPVNKVWYLGIDMYVENGARLLVYGPAAGGDVRELRLKSDSSTAANAYVELRADHGWLDIRNTKITSWDATVNGPNTRTNFGRAFIHARSKLDPDGKTAHESRMDVVNSEICYLGHYATEAYGLTWKVVDTTAVYLPPGSTTNDLFDLVNVYGDILNSHIHHNFFGVYTYGHFGGRWATNEVNNNFAYGFDPHDDSDYLVIEGNHVHHNGWHGIIASKRCDHGILRGNLSHDNGLEPTNPHGHGIMLHRSSNNWLVENNQSYNNADTGIAIFACDRTVIRNNTCRSNSNAGIRLSVGSENSWVEGNQVLASGGNAFYLYEGNDPPELDEGELLPSGRCRQNTFTNNFVNGYGREAIKSANADSNVFAGNVFIGLNTVLRFENGTNNLVSANILPSDTLAKLVGTVTNTLRLFTTTTFASQPRLTLQLDDPYSTATFTDKTCAIFISDQTNLTTTVTSSGSKATLTSAQVGTGPGLVLTRNFFVVPNTGSAQINITTWNVGGNNRNKAWTVRGSSASMQISYRVGDLRANTNYEVRRSFIRIATVRSDSQGYISFTSTPGSTASVTYTVQ